MFKCIECNESMLKDAFVCNLCERNKRAKNTTALDHHTELIRNQHCRLIDMGEGSKENEGSQYWDHTFRHGPCNNDGDTMEHDQANPDYLSSERIDALERAKNPPINENRARALELLQEGAGLLTDREKIAVQDFAKGVLQKNTAKRIGVSQPAINQAAKRGLNKLKKFCGGKL